MSFLWAPQPELLRASQKDASSLAALRTEVKDIAHELFRHRAVTADAEIDLLCALAYYGLPLSANERTLGEEYCDILAVSNTQTSPDARQAALIVDAGDADSPLRAPEAESVLYGPPLPSASLQGAGPSLSLRAPAAESSSSSLAPAAPSEVSTANQAVLTQEPPRELLRDASRPLQLPQTLALTSPSRAARALFVFFNAIAPYIAAKWTPSSHPTLSLPRFAAFSGQNHSSSPPSLLARTHARLSHAAATLAAYLKYLLKRVLFLAHVWLPRVEPCNLFLFYLFGAFATLPHRLTGRRYISLSRPLHRTRFGVLSLLLLLRGAIAAIRALAAARARSQRRLGWERRRLARARAKQAAAVETRSLTRRMRWRQKGMLARARAMGQGASAQEAADAAAKAEAAAEAEDRANEDAAFADLRALEPFLAEVDAEAEAAGGVDALEAAAAAEEDEGGAVVGGHVLGGGGPNNSGNAIKSSKEGAGAAGKGASESTSASASASASGGGGSELLPSVVCSICMGEATAATATECGHIFCWDCGAQALRREPRCPTCRAECRLEGLLRLHQYK